MDSKTQGSPALPKKLDIPKEKTDPIALRGLTPSPQPFDTLPPTLLCCKHLKGAESTCGRRFQAHHP